MPRILREFEVAKNKQLKNVMGSLLPSGAIPPVLRAASVAAEKPIHEITKAERERLVQVLKHFPIRLTGLRGYNEAIITQGGVSVRGDCSGYNGVKESERLVFRRGSAGCGCADRWL